MSWSSKYSQDERGYSLDQTTREGSIHSHVSSTHSEKRLSRSNPLDYYGKISVEAMALPQIGAKRQGGDVEKGPASKGPPPGVPAGFDPSQFPDGGLEAWMVIAGGFCCLFCSFGWINCIGVFQDYYQSHQLAHLSPSTIAWITSLETFMMFAGGPVIGKLYDNYGPRYLLITGTILHVFGLMMTSISYKYYQFILAQGIVSPIGASMIFYPALSTAMTWFFKRRALALGVIASGSSFGGVIFPIMVEQLVPQVGFGWTMRICAFLILCMMIIANLTVHSRTPPNPRPLVLLEFVRPLKELPFALITLGSFFFFFGMFLPINYIILQAIRDGMSAGLAGYLVPILNAVSLFGRIIPGYVADKVGRFNVMVTMCFFTGIIVLALWMPAASNAPIILFTALYGFGSGAFISMSPSLIAQISDVRQIGVRTGSLYAIISVAALVSNPIGGALVVGMKGSYVGLQVFCGVMCLAGGAMMLAARIVVGGTSLKKKV
ncbi:hypothetical protein B0A49_02698 [Cryomyces minteri]|uniref:Major facilitator superfamily (MFS) profile domain-containing protein n=1 Tax=Cryomyces minteri TaxID=331657 RepID=A0A4U0XQ58_9PEZI|nr:hypothetical protein B0A49_02698 [Cryomyces minteri]